MSTTSRDDAAGHPDRGLHDLLARHFDGGLTADEQRHLAERLAVSPAARATLARFLRLEGAMFRLAAAGLVAPPADKAGVAVPVHAVPVHAVPVESGPTLPTCRRRAAFAVAGGLLAAIAVAVAWRSLPEIVGARGSGTPGSIDAVADRWLELRRAPQSAEATVSEPTPGGATTGGATTGGATVSEPPAVADSTADPGQDADDPGSDAPPPPGWLVAALADEAATPTTPDAS